MSKEKIIPLLKKITAIIVIVLSCVIFGWYIATHPEVIKTILALNPVTLLLLTFGYTLTVIANGLALFYSLQLIGKKIPFVNNLILTGYSSIINFFGPLQSGPGFRAVYLNKFHSVSIKDFMLVTIGFYLFFGVINGVILGAALLMRLPYIASILVAITAIVMIPIGNHFIRRAQKKRFMKFLSFIRYPSFWMLGVSTLGLIMSTVFIYHIELVAVGAHVTLLQSIIYTAAANLAMFVSLTPGALGFRESFLVLSEQLHHIPVDVILHTSIIDRAFYVLFLLVMFLVLLAMNVKKRLRVKQGSLSE